MDKKRIVILTITLILAVLFATSRFFFKTKVEKTSGIPTSVIQPSKIDQLTKVISQGDLSQLRELMKESTTQERKNAALKLALKNNDIEIVRMLLQWGASPDSDSDLAHSLLNLAVNNVDEALVKKAIEAGADLNAKTEDGSTLLIDAVKQREMRKIDLLLKLDADLNLRDKHAAWSALVHAIHLSTHIVQDGMAVSGDYEIVQKLLSMGAEINEKESKGSVLYQAVPCNNVEIVQLLLDAGCDPRVTLYWEPKRITPMLNAARPQLPEGGTNSWAKDALCTIHFSKKRISFLKKVLLDRTQLGLNTTHVEDEIAYCNNLVEELEPQYAKWLEYFNKDEATRQAADSHGNNFDEIELQAKINDMENGEERQDLVNKLYRIQSANRLHEQIKNAQQCIEDVDRELLTTKRGSDIASLGGRKASCQRTLASAERELLELQERDNSENSN